ncbi:MAG TPA: hypothetical protein VGM86_12620 [Thermoanaerobaculia bacterium]
MEIRKERWPGDLPGYLAVAVALALWRLFFPGLMSQDSIIQYGQAVTGQYNDWQPPLMAIVLRAVLGLGGALGLLMLAQCLAGVFGVRALARESLELLCGDRVPPRRAAWLALLVLLLLLLPWSPLAFYLMTFWKDAWAAVFLLWIGALAIALFRRGAEPRRVALLVVLSALLGLVRHNAVAILPLLGLVLWLGLRRAGVGRRAALALAAAPLALWLVANPLIDALFRVEKLHPDSQIMALDLVGLCAAGRDLCAELPWTRSHVRDEAGLARYRPGDIGLIFWDDPSPVDKTMRLDYPRLRAEYLHAVRRFPGELARVKLAAFETLLGIDQTSYFFHGTIVENPYGLRLADRFAPARERLRGVVTGVAESGWRWLGGVHLVWIAVNVLWVAVLLALSFRSGDGRYRFLACLLLVPLGYYLSYLAATPTHDYRFMYPSTLMVQCVTISWLLSWLASRSWSRSSS